ncbi:GL19644 [Drosophila persimilis]|uniref:GL19644 n=1 Tax=Drosophila persimilis TaxID=7234 RepID=B4G7Q5_DROPE|nr:GL19644 [Drosophila persimilis]
MAAAATVSSHSVAEANEGKADLVCEECDYYGSTATILIDSSTQTDGDEGEEEEEEEEDDGEAVVKPVRTKLAQIVEEAEAEAETEADTPATNGMRNIDSDSVRCPPHDSNGIDNDISLDIETNSVIGEGHALEEAEEEHIPKPSEDRLEDMEAEEEVEQEEAQEEEQEEGQVEELELELEEVDEDQDQIDSVARLTGIALEMGYARIIDYDNFRIIEHVIESDDDDDGDADGDVAQGPAASSSQELQQACHDLVTFIGESYQVIDRSGNHAHYQSPALVPIVDNNNNNRASNDSRVAPATGRKPSNGMDGTEQLNQNPSTSSTAAVAAGAGPTSSTSSALIKAYKSNLTPLAPPFQPAALKAKQQSAAGGNTTSTSNMSLATTTTSQSSSSTSTLYAAYEQTTVYYQQQMMQQQLQLPLLQQQQLSPQAAATATATTLCSTWWHAAHSFASGHGKRRPIAARAIDYLDADSRRRCNGSNSRSHRPHSGCNSRCRGISGGSSSSDSGNIFDWRRLATCGGANLHRHQWGIS